MDGESLLCTCGEAIRIWPDGHRTSLYDQRPHLDHSAYQEWARRWGFTTESLGWLYEVVNYPGSIRDQLVSPRLLRACGLLPGVNWSGRGTTTAGQPLSGFSAEHPWDHLLECDTPFPKPAVRPLTRVEALFSDGNGEVHEIIPTAAKWAKAASNRKVAATANERWV